MFAADFGARKMAQDMRVLDMPERSLFSAWEGCIRNALEAKRAVEEEVSTAKRINVSKDLCAEPVSS